ncbi:MAG: penicillin-binding protein [Actinobacteria bacterium]|uniref:peptidoglycan glycosyltransferase n=1 Tax=freshwater metagenome TaxID=449393 RepID=A0A6J7LBX7_9ZZZZ|nr:penicillin-binding protein [Actinomycetota bacterium]MSW22607.1 penicillin-binding protein [Actinomycetota bacterium]MSX04353.1 penicillin-binding protein [Actinomycetota bacterium]MSX60875.1 penicillin-binding protein [Actinomycetota bacterium]MSX83897.1 penicillin-binding protein [Actinomycetota bacterium]
MANLRGNLFRYGIFATGIGFILAVLGFAYAYFTVSIPDANSFVNSQSTIIQYADGQEIGRLGSENRTVVKLANIPLHVRQAVMAAEDRNFYTQSAVSPVGIARALFNNLKSGTLNGQGGSTITQQYAKTAFLTPERTITRKVKELIIAIKLQNQMSKDDILESYLNTIYFGRGSYGIQTASEVYFGKSVSNLSVSQAAILASILRSPGYYDPSYSKENATRLEARWKYVIDGMIAKEWLTKTDAAKLTYPVTRDRVTSGALAGPKGYVISWVVHELAKLGFSEAQLQTGGYVIKTTLEKKNQVAAVRAMDGRGPKNAPESFHAALVSIRPGTGEIVALYGGKDYLVTQLNGATQSITQAGSGFKPFAIIAALEQGIPLTSIWNGESPQVFDDVGKPYPVFNYGNEQEGEIDLLAATAHSINTIFVPLGIKAGLDNVVDVARRAGIPSTVALMPTPSISLGVASPHVIDMASAYATFAANGTYATPFIIKEVLGANKGVLYEGKIKAQQAFQPDVMADLTYALEQVTQYGTGGAAASGVGRPIAGKTGTTTDNASAWFNGYTVEFATTVAMFRDDATQSLNGIGGNYAFTGGTFPAQVWNTYTKIAQKGMPATSFPEPANIGGTEPISYLDAVPTLDPELAGKYESGATKKKKLAAKQ